MKAKTQKKDSQNQKFDDPQDRMGGVSNHMYTLWLFNIAMV